MKEFKAVREQRNKSRHEVMMANLRHYSAAINGRQEGDPARRRGRGAANQCHSLYVIGAGASVQMAMVMDRCAGRVSSSDLRHIWTLALGKLNYIANEYEQRRWKKH